MLVSRVALVCLVSCLIFQVVAGIHHHGGGGGGLGILLGVGLLAKLLEGHHHSHHHHHHHVKYVPIPRLALQVCKLSANLSRQACKSETSLQQVNASLEVTIGRTCSKLALQTIAKTKYEHNPG
ncbi:hypothetical protein AVEN_56310-1 [Araneus ventricosus]|uniref:Secreted protein n=1 Tax=Araneus ventricosus TaxID=182803 RepID=A0A4Y2W0A0_ARAVE|nr:hypothetical protein AVEN_56310-1 [Araneus ventricosus]